MRKSKMASKRKFVLHTEEELSKKQRALVPKNTRRSNEKAVRAFQAYLDEVNEPKPILELTVEELDKHLSGFWPSLRKIPKEEGGENEENEPEKYKTSSLDGFRYGLKRYCITPNSHEHF